MTGRLLRAAGVTVAAVTVTDLGPEVTATRIDVATSGGTQPVTTRLADGLAIAAITGAPLAVDGPLMDRLAKPAAGPSPLGPFGDGVRETPGPPQRQRFEPRNLEFADGLRRWQLGGTFLRQGAGFDYSCAVEDGRVTLAATVAEPAGFAFLNQAIFADDYRGATVTFRADLRAAGAVVRAGLALRVTTEGRNTAQGRNTAGTDPWHDPANHFADITTADDWTRHEVTAEIPPDADLIGFGVYLNGPGQVEFRSPRLDR